jgi:hypothetical protein
VAKNVLYNIRIPQWVSELHDYKYKKITLSGTINPNKEKYNMVTFKLVGVALEERVVEMEVETPDDIEDVEKLATTEFLQQHPECISVEWVKTNGNSQ